MRKQAKPTRANDGSERRRTQRGCLLLLLDSAPPYNRTRTHVVRAKKENKMKPDLQEKDQVYVSAAAVVVQKR